MSEHAEAPRTGFVSRRPGTVTADARSLTLHQQAMRATLARIEKIERKIASLQAEQVALTASFIDDRMRFDEVHGFLSDPAQYRGMVAEVAIAKQVSVTTAAGFMDDAWAMT